MAPGVAGMENHNKCYRILGNSRTLQFVSFCKRNLVWEETPRWQSLAELAGQQNSIIGLSATVFHYSVYNFVMDI